MAHIYRLISNSVGSYLPAKAMASFLPSVFKHALKPNSTMSAEYGKYPPGAGLDFPFRGPAFKGRLLGFALALFGLSFLAGPVCGAGLPDRNPAPATQAVINLGAAAQYALVGRYIELHNAEVYGNAAIGASGSCSPTPSYNLQFQSPGILYGTAYVATGAVITGQTSNAQGGIVTNNAGVSQAFADAMSAYSAALALVPDQIITGNISSPTTITASHGGQYVIRITGNITRPLILNPAPGQATKFIVIVEGTINLGGSDTVGASSSAGSKDVLIVMQGAGSNLTSHVDNFIYGTILAPFRGATFHGFAGAMISGCEYVKFQSGAQLQFVGYEPASGSCPPGTITATAGPDASICAGGGATLSVTATGGTGTYTYAWSTGSSGSSITVNPGETTTYSVTVTDGSGCTAGASATVTVEDGLSSGGQIGYDETSCGSFNPALIQNLSSATSNNYSTGTSCCELSGFGRPQKVLLRYTGESCAASTTTQDPSKWNCTGAPNGDPSVYIIANDNTSPTSGRIWFSGNVSLNGAFLADATAAGQTQLASNTYIHIYNQQGGTVIQTVQIHTSCSAPLITGEQWGSLVLLDILGSGGVQCGGPVANATYQWQYRDGTSGAWINIPGATGATYDPTAITQTRQYRRMATAGSSCPSLPSNIVTKTVSTNLALAISGNTDLCGGQSTTLTALVAGGTPPFVYAWSTGSSGVSITVSPSGTTTYSVTVTQAGGCTVTASATVFVSGLVTGGVIGYDEQNCGGFDPALIQNLGDALAPGQSSGQDCCDTADPDQLFLQYTGDGCGATVTNQEDGKWSCTDFAGGPSGDPDVYIIVNSSSTPTSGTIWFAGNVSQGGTFLASSGASNFSSNSYIHIYSQQGGTLLQRLQIHTSCSTPIVVGDQWGAIRLLSVIMTNGQSCGATGGTATYQWQYRDGTSGAWIDIPGAAGSSYDPGPITQTRQYRRLASNGGTCPPAPSNVVTKTVSSSLNVAISGNTDLCGGQSTTLTALVAGGNPPFTYAWSTGSSGISITVTPSATATYSVTVTEQGGCAVTASATVFVGGLVSGGAIGYDEANCGGYDPALIQNLSDALAPGQSSGQDCCDGSSGSKPDQLLMQYTGSNCGATMTNQEAGKWSCADFAGGPNGDTDVYIIANTSSTPTSGTQWFAGNVSLGGTFLVNSGSSDFGSNTYFHIYSQQGGTLLQTIGVHTSCSTPIVVGDQWGSVRLLSVTQNNGGTCGATGGSAAYQWQYRDGTSGAWIDIPGATGASYDPAFISNTRQYRRQATNGVNCPPAYSNIVTKTVNPGLIVNITGNTQVCGSASTTLSAVIISGTGPYTYAWSTGSTASSITVSPSATQSYSVTVTGAGGCTTIASATVEVGGLVDGGTIGYDEAFCAPFNPALIVGTSEPIGSGSFGDDCCDTADPDQLLMRYTGDGCGASNTQQGDGKWSCTDFAGGPNGDNQVYIIANSSTTPTATPQWFAGNVSLGGTFVANSGASNFSSNTYIHIFSQQGGTLLQTLKVHTSCSTPLVAGDQWGSVQLLQVTFQNGSTCGGTPVNATYQWQYMDANSGGWVDIPGATGPDYDPPFITITTQYRRLAYNGTFCPPAISNVVEKRIELLVNANAGNDVTICGSANTTLSASASGGFPPYTYAWDNGLGAGQTHVVNPTSTTTYTVTVTDSFGCQGTDQVTVTVNDAPIVNAGPDVSICLGQSTTLTASAAGGNGSYTYTWSNGLGAGASHTVSPAATTTYTVTVTDGNGCTDTDQVTVTVNGQPLVNAGTDITICSGTSTTLTATTTGGDGNYTYAWDNGLGSGASHTVSPLATTTYTVTVTDGTGCTDTDQVTVTVNGNPTADAGPDVAICAGESTDLTASALGGGGNYTFEWDNGLGFGAMKTASPAITTTYTVTVTDGNGCMDTDQVTVTVNPSPVADAGPDVAICESASATLTASATGGDGNYTYAWNNGLGAGASHTISPIQTTTYTVTVTDGNGCTDIDMVTVTVNPMPDIAIVNKECIPANQFEHYYIDLTVDPGVTITASEGTVTDNGNGSFRIDQITTGNSVTITATDPNTNCQNTQIVTSPDCDCQSVPVPASDGDKTICEDSAIPALTVTIAGASHTVDWYDAPTGGNLLLAGSTSFTPPGAGTYYAEGRNINDGCVSDSRTPVTLTIYPLPVAEAGNDVAICAGSSTTLVGSATDGDGNYTYAWDNGLGAGSTHTVSPLVTTTYRLTVTDGNGCQDVDQMVVTVNPVPTADAGPDAAICQGSSTTLSATAAGGGGNYSFSWSNGLGAGANKTVSPLATTTYTVTVTDGNGCTDTDQVTVTVNDNPLADAGPDVTICEGSSTTLTASAAGGGGNYTFAWDNGLGAGASHVVSPLTTTTYTVTVTDGNGCTDTDQVTVTVNDSPVADAGPDASICEGESTTLSASAAGGTPGYTYTWDNGLGTGASHTVSPLVTTTYTLTVTDSNGCTDTDQVTVTVNDSPVANAGADATICAGSSATLTASATGGDGNYTYTWDNGLGAGASHTVSPIVTTTYTVTVTDGNGCIDVDQVTIIVIQNFDDAGTISGDEAHCGPYDPTPIVGTSDPSGCVGAAPEFRWQTKLPADATWATIPGATGMDYDPGFITETTQYRRQARPDGSSSAWLSSNVVTKTVYPEPVVNAGADVAICLGESTILSASATGGTPGYTYAWDNGLGAGANHTVSPAVTTTYTVTVTDTNGCTDVDQVVVTVNGNPSADAGPDVSICLGSSTTLTATASGGDGNYTFTWDNGLGDGDSHIVNPNTTTTYTVTVTDGNGCIDIDQVVVTVNDNPLANAGPDVALCLGSSTVLTATASGGGGNYTFAWDNGLGAGASHTVNPLATTTYTVTVTDGNGCTDTDQVVVTVNDNPQVNAGPDVSICTGSSTTLTATGFDGDGNYTFSWDNGLGAGASHTVSPAATTTYTVTVTDGNGCTNTDQLTVTVNDAPVVNAGPDVTICEGSSTTLTASATGGDGNYTYSWDNGLGAGASHTVSPAHTITYTVTVTDGNGCTDTDQVTVTVNPAPLVDAGQDQDVCEGSSVQLGGSIGGSATSAAWITSGDGLFNNVNLLNAIYFPGPSDIAAGTVALTLVTNDPAGPCVAVSGMVTITISDAPTVNAGDNQSICETDVANLNASFAGTATSATWSTNGDGGFTDINSLTATYTPGPNDINNGQVTLTLTTNDPIGPCPAAVDNLLLTIYDAPEVDAGPNQQICEGATVTVNGQIGGSATSSVWVTSGDGTFANPNALSTVYTPGPTDISVGSVTLELFTNNPFGPCPAESDQMVIIIFDNPTANAGPDQTICEDEVASISGSVGGGAVTGSWSTSGDGAFGNANALTTTYIPGAADIAAGTVTLILITNDPAGPCTPATDDVVIAITPGTPTATVVNGTVCSENSPYTTGTDNVLDLNSLITSGPTTGTWNDDDNTGALAGSVFTATLGMQGQTFQFTYTIPGLDGPGNGACNDQVYTIDVTVQDCFASIGDYVWEDTNGNGIQDDGPTGIPGVAVTLTGTTTVGGLPINDNTITDANGNYQFTLLPPGSYKLTFGTPAGYNFTNLDAGGDDTTDSDADPNNGGMTVFETLVAGEDNPTYDAGLVQSAFIGDYVWQDTDGDGIQDAGEPPIPGVTVNLYEDNNQDGVPDGAPIATDVTGANGEYGFPVAPGSYVVEFVTPAGFDGSPQDQGGNDAVDSDADPNTGLTGTITVNSGETDLTNDAGFYEPASLGDYVWLDTDADGIQDVGEAGIGGVTVNLLDGGGAFLATTTTAPDGSYSFMGLAPGDYIVEFLAPAGYAPSPQDQGGDDTADSDASPATGRTGVIALSSGEDDPTNDAGYYQSAFIGDYVWQDTDGDGTQDAGEPPIPGVTVNLYEDNNQDGVPDGAPIATDVTGANGEYGFPVAPGSYVVEFVAPAGFDGTLQDQGGNDAADSDADPNTGLTGTITVNSGDTDLTNDAGYYEPASLGDFVWQDTDADGIQDAGEPGIGGVTVNLLDGGGAFLQSTTTAPDGSYSFTNLAPGDYIVEFVGPAGFAPSPQDQGGDDTIDSDANPGTGQSGIVNLESGEDDPTIDAGYYESAFIGDFVWQDTDGDGIQDAGEPGIPGVTVNLYADANQDGIPDGAPIATDVTDANGEYGFPVAPGSYVVEFVAPAGFDSTPQDQGGNDALDSDADPNAGLTGTITVNSGETDLTNDAGYYEPASLGDFVWQDTDADGIQDAGEAGIGGVTVNLLDGGGAFLQSTTTAPDGSYSFTNLAPGDYVVEFVGPAGFAPSPQDQGGDDTADSDANPGTGQTGIITLSSGEDDPTNDAGYYESAFIGDYVWQDTDGDGIQDAGEPPIPGVTVNLYEDNNQDGVPDGAPIATDVTDANGEYGFPVNPGSYVVEFVTPPGFTGTPQDQGGNPEHGPYRHHHSK